MLQIINLCTLFQMIKYFVAAVAQTRKGKFMNICMYLEFIYLFVKNYIM